jgi:GNS1/SUR4 family.
MISFDENFHHILKDNFPLDFDGLFVLSDEEVDSRFFMSSWVPVTVTLVAYLVFVLYIGPKWMATRKPFQINRILMVYNLGQTLASLYVVSSVSR